MSHNTTHKNRIYPFLLYVRRLVLDPTNLLISVGLCTLIHHHVYLDKQWFSCRSMSCDATQHTVTSSSNLVARHRATWSNVKITVCVNRPKVTTLRRRSTYLIDQFSQMYSQA
jgi:hypothetical protein